MRPVNTALLLLSLTAAIPPGRAAGAEPEPWRDGEQLVCKVSWGVIPAAEGTYRARRLDGGSWRLSLDLKSTGLVEKIAQIRSRAVSTVGVAPWTSRQFDADRREGAHAYRYSRQLGAGRSSGLYLNHLKEERKPIALPGPAVDDFVSMLYHLRRHDWARQPELELIVSDRCKIDRGRAVLRRTETIRDAAGAERESLLIEARPVEHGRVVDKYCLQLWLAAGRDRTPLLARLKFKYGTVTIRLTPGAPSPGPAGGVGGAD
jgi:hypothetical protein